MFQSSGCKAKQKVRSSRKYPYLHHNGNWKFSARVGVKGPGSSRGEGVGQWIFSIPIQVSILSSSKILPYQMLLHVGRSFTRKNTLPVLYVIALHLEENFFLWKALGKLTSSKNKYKEHAVAWTRPPLLVTSLLKRFSVEWHALWSFVFVTLIQSLKKASEKSKGFRHLVDLHIIYW